MTGDFLIQLVFRSAHQSVTPFLSGAPPPKKNPGPAPGECFTMDFFHMLANGRGFMCVGKDGVWCKQDNLHRMNDI